MTRGDVEEIKGHFDKVAQELRTELRSEFQSGLGGLGAELRSEFQSGLSRLGAELRQEMAGLGADLRQEMAGLGAELRQEMAGLGAELRQEMVGLGAELRQEMVGLGADLRQEMAVRGTELRQEMAEVRHYTGALAEDLRSDIRAVADGVALANERIADVDLRVDTLTSEVRRGFAGVRAEMHRLHETDDDLRRRLDAQDPRGA